ncbi:fibronectin-like isoform X2 [Mizuhopecten yessoensis]|uniref:fibronectin-like isoform X2 n=1 Tax=Mizuhopecten yessoensis TaxID=6573 RepID=UPI000B459856|nr:fibronectin-like isoform X2 [Mizuhopecten yessoensis]
MSECIAGNTGENVCRCQLGYFDSNSYSSADGVCTSMNGLIAKSFAVGVEGTSTVTIEWVAPSPESKQVKRYEVHWTPLLPNGTGNYSAGNATNVRLIGFVSGQQYAFYVKTIEHGSRRYEQYVQTASKSITMDAGLGVACNASNIACADYNSNCAKTDNGLSTVCRCRASFFDSNGFNTPGGMCINMSTLAVTDLTLVTEGTETVNISWTPPPLEYTDQVSRYVVSWTPVTHINGSVSYNALLSTDIQLVGFTPGQTYTFYIYSVESGSRKTEQNISSVPSVITMKPHTPSDFTETDVDGPVITLSWFLHKGVKTFYEVISTPTLGMANVTTESITYSVNVSDGQQYNTSITAVSGNERSDPLYSSFTTVSKTPDPPTLSNTTFCNSTTNESIALVWTAPEYPRGNIQYYVVKSITTGAIYTTISGKTEYVVAGLKPGTLYTFSVASVNDAVTYGNQSDYSKQYECRTDAAISMAPSTLLVTQIQSREFTLNWTKPTITNGALSGYRLTVTDGSACVKEVIFACHTCPLWVAIPYDCPVGTKQTVVVLPIHLDGVFNYTVHDILPYTNYTVSVLAVNAAGDGVPVTEYTATDQEVPQHPTDLNVSVLSATEIFVTWTISGLEPGPTTFELHVIPGIPEINRTETIRGFYTRDYTVKNLEEFRTYTFNITAVTDKGSSGFQQALPSATTQAIVPDTVGNFLVTRPDGPNFATVRVSWQLPSLLDRNSDVTQFVFSYNSTGGNVTSHSEVIAVDSDPNPVTKNVTVVPLNTYIIEVYAVGEDSTGSILIGTKSMMTYFAPAGPPPLDVDESIIPSTSNIDIQATHTTFALNIEKRFFTNIVYGPIVDYTLVLCKERCTGLDDKSETKAENYLSTLDGWKAAKTKGFSQMYRAMSKSEFDSAFIAGNKAATTFRIVIGKVTNCSQSTKQYCNGPLQVESTYFLKAAICTVGGCTLSSKYGPFSTLEGFDMLSTYCITYLSNYH